jgi:hypothetical protein
MHAATAKLAQTVSKITQGTKTERATVTLR